MIRFDSPLLLAAAIALVACTCVAALVRRIDLRPLTRALLGAGLLLLSLAAGGAALELRRPGRVAVLVDVSPSTRTADYRSRASLEARVAELLGGARHEIREFSPDVDSSWPAGFEAVLLFSDGRFDPARAAPPTYAVIDPELSAAKDARVDWFEPRERMLVAAVSNNGAPRELSLNGSAETVSASQVVVRPLEQTTGVVVARLNRGDAWPENDALSVHVPPPPQRERWWVGGSAPSGDWTSVAPDSLPLDATEYLRPALVVLDNVPADALSPAQHERLLQYVRDLGGGVILLGGDRAFAAGGYPGTPFETISPLSSTPPQPVTHWVLLADSSGSMAGPAGGAGASATRWQLAADAVARVLPHLPPHDPVSVGSFARELRWWSRGKTARELNQLAPPAGLSPHGPTNLQPALESIASSSDGSASTEVLLLTDADTKLDPPALGARLRSKRVRVHLLATADVRADNPVRQLVDSTGGTALAQPDPQRWATSLRELMRAASPPGVFDEPHAVRFEGALAPLRGRTVERLNLLWSKEKATRLATATRDVNERAAAAMWNVGAGRAAAVAFSPTAEEVEALAALVASPPRDARFTLTWDVGRALRVTIDASDGGRMLNGLSFNLELADASDPSRGREAHAIPQVAPGRYALSLPAPRTARLATVQHDQRIVAQRAIAGRYAPEFDEIGTDRATLRRLAERTGGRVIEPTDTAPIDFNWPRRRYDATAPLATTGVALVALGLICWKLR